MKSTFMIYTELFWWHLLTLCWILMEQNTFGRCVHTFVCVCVWTPKVWMKNSNKIYKKKKSVCGYDIVCGL